MKKSIIILLALIVAGIAAFIFFGGQEAAQEEAAQTAPPVAQVKEIYVYSSRKEELIKHLFEEFEKDSGVKVKFVTDKAGKLIERLKTEGARSPGDVFLTSDVGNLAYAKSLGLLAQTDSQILRDNIMEQYRDKDGYWYGLSARARVILYSKERVKPEELSSYEALVYPYWRGRVLIRSSSNIYNQSLLASIIEAQGQIKAERWAAGIVGNMARTPQGGDTDQIRAVAAGEGDVAIANSYYYGRLVASDKPEDQEVVSKVGIFFPNQAGSAGKAPSYFKDGDLERGTHVNVSGGAVLATSKHKDAARQLLEFLSSKKAQEIYANVNHEFPVNPNIALSKIVADFGTFKADALPLYTLEKHRAEVVRMMDRVGWR